MDGLKVWMNDRRGVRTKHTMRCGDGRKPSDFIQLRFHSVEATMRASIE